MGVARLKEIGEELFYENCSLQTKEKYAGGFLWDRNITSYYPDQGFRLPYHLYLDRPEILEKFIFVPDNPRNFKYGTRLITDDDALDLVERFLEICSILSSEGDQNEDWQVRISWLQSLVAELWDSRGLYPGLAKALDYLKFQEAIPYFKAEVLAGREKEAKTIIFEFLEGQVKSIPGLQLTEDREKKIIRQWMLKGNDERLLLKEVLLRFDLSLDQIERILSEKRLTNGIEATLCEIADNPYILSEQFCGDGPDDVITFNKIDHGVFPSPELGGEFLFGTDDWRRLRGLCVERLKREDKHSFLNAVRVIHDINHKLSFLPDWKRHQFHERYLSVDEEELSGALTFREKDGKKYIYLKDIFLAERLLEEQIRSLANRPDITFSSPVTVRHWHDYLYNTNSILVQKNPSKYEEAIQGQATVCQRIFSRIDWLTEQKPECLGNLEINLRQMENLLTGSGTGILDLANLFIRANSGANTNLKTEETGTRAEQILSRVQEGGDIDQDLRVVYWNNYDDLDQKLAHEIITDMEKDTNSTFNPERPYELWTLAFQKDGSQRRPEYQQIISPYRGERFGTDYLNVLLQQKANSFMPDRIGLLGNVTIFDKVIQYRNRPRSNPIWAYNTKTKGAEPIEVYNGELGFVKPHGFDGDKWRRGYFKFKHFQVVFSRKSNYWVGYGAELGKNAKGWWIPVEKVEENLELAYAISVHKAQGSEFERVYFILPKEKKTLLSKEMFYTAITRSYRHCTILIQEDIAPLLRMRRPESSHLLNINSSIFNFLPLPEEMMVMGSWYEEGKIHSTLANYMVRSKSEVIIANMLFERGIPFKYEIPLFAPDGTFYLPDFTVTWHGEDWYWEHLGLMEQDEYRNHWDTKQQWYNKNFPGRLVTTEESGNLSICAKEIIDKYFS
ncbi:MAG: ATP-binding domain-containing protein [Desulfotomaculaceae bacterium]|nr:ATP-binding domain-containing protein [Desulfotomaculaceae bacterium]